MESFKKELEGQKERSRSAAAIETLDWHEIQKIDEVEFVGYDHLEAEVHISKMRTVKTKGKEQYHLVFDKTPFYAESGGQAGDIGTISNANETINIINTIKENNLTIHIAESLPTSPKSTFFAKVDKEKRISTANNHSATHLLHNALRKVLGTHVEQKGSLVNSEYLRFDFSHFQKVTDEEIRQVEILVNQKIRQNIALNEHRGVPIEQAQKMGAMALFGEKYGDLVRVIQFGESVELCGGTHVPSTGQIGFIKIISEGAISAGVRRIEAITGVKAEEFLYNQVDAIKEVKQVLGNPSNLIQSASKLIEENTNLRKEIEGMMKEKLQVVKSELKLAIEHRNGVNIIAKKVDISSPDAIKDLAYQLKNEIDNLFLVLGSVSEGKAMLTVMLDEKLVESKKLNASNIVREAAKEIQGGGGGQPFYATAGGKNPAGIEAAINKAIAVLG